MTPKIIWLNGPPRSGKDTLGQQLADHYNILHKKDTAIMKLAQPIKDGVKAFLGISDEEWYAIDVLGKGKDDPHATSLTMGKSLRECQIGISEQFAKPFWDKQIFGKLLLERMKRKFPLCAGDSMIFITDAGFSYECDPVVNYYGPENNVVIRLQRDGTDYSKDSRSYVDLSHLGVPHIDVSNNGTLDEARNAIHYALKEIRGWNL